MSAIVNSMASGSGGGSGIDGMYCIVLYCVVYFSTLGVYLLIRSG